MARASDAIVDHPHEGRWPVSAAFVSWGIALLAFALLWQAGREALPWAFVYPSAWVWPLKDQISAFFAWLVELDLGLFTFTDVTRTISWLVEQPYRLALGLLSSGLVHGQGSDSVQVLPPLAWLTITLLAALLGFVAGGFRLALLAAACFLYLAVFGQWQSAMVTLASIVIAVPLGSLGGLLLGLAAYRARWFERLLEPVLDLMQTVPVFAYLVPILMLFGFNPVAAILATFIYAMPPMVRITTHALRDVPETTVELGRMTGCTRGQMTWKVLMPSALPGLMVGVNQVIMLSLNMVIIASMIGAGGLGFDVLAALRRLDIGAGIESGVAIVVLAIALDRISQGFAERSRVHVRHTVAGGPLRRHSLLVGFAGLLLLATLAAALLPAMQAYPEAWRVTTAPWWNEQVKWLNVNFFDALEAFKTFVLTWLLVPVKRLLLGLPWLGVVGLVTLAGWRLEGPRLALTCLALALFIAVTGQWEKAMITLYLCGFSAVVAALLGIPIGIWAAGSPARRRWVEAAIDTLQTLPSFVYLIPVVMLFRVGEFTAMIAVVLYAIAPAIRYTIHGLTQVDPQLIEAGTANGCTRLQLLGKIRLRLAFPEIMLGVNQTVMLAISMLVITALVGTRDLGQEVYIALTKANTGQGVVAGLAIAFIAIIADRLLRAGAARMRARLGLR